MDINAEISDMKVALASLEAKAKALEKPKQWEPRGGAYWVSSSGDVLDGEPIIRTSKFGVERQTKKATEKACASMRTHNRLLAYVDEFGGDWEANWSDNHQHNYYVYYAHLRMVWSATTSSTVCASGTVYMSKDCALELAAKLNSGEVVL
tara:strand:+ start:129 stop:578 length:450 start_codon:yes stop_codon:yes gene_type:complete